MNRYTLGILIPVVVVIITICTFSSDDYSSVVDINSQQITKPSGLPNKSATKKIRSKRFFRFFFRYTASPPKNDVLKVYMEEVAENEINSILDTDSISEEKRDFLEKSQGLIAQKNSLQKAELGAYDAISDPDQREAFKKAFQQKIIDLDEITYQIATGKLTQEEGRAKKKEINDRFTDKEQLEIPEDELVKIKRVQVNSFIKTYERRE